MNRFISGIFILLLISSFHTATSFGQSASAEVDSTFQKYMSQAWDQVQKEGFSDSLQNAFSVEFYQYYTENPDTETGGKAFAQAFLMWSNTGKSDFITEAIQTLEYDSELWRMIIFPIQNIYARNEDMEISEYYNFIENLSDKLEEPKSISEALLVLLRWKSERDDSKDEAVELARTLVELNADEFYVQQGLGYLHEFESLNIGQHAPDFKFQSLDGDEISLSSLEGSHIILEFWATWCGPCLPEIPYLKSLYERYHDNDFTVIGISLDRNKDTLVNFIAENEIPWPQIYAEDGWEGELPRLFNVLGIPKMYLLDPDGVIIGRDLRGEEMVLKIQNLMDP